MTKPVWQRPWNWWLGVTLQLCAFPGLIFNAGLLVSISSRRSYYLARDCDWAVLFQLWSLGLGFIVCLPLLTIGRLFVGYWGPLSVVWFSAIFYLMIQHAFLIYAACGVETPSG